MTTFDTPEPISAKIEIAIGDVRIKAGDRNTTVVEVVPRDASSDEDRKAAELTRIEYADNQLLVKSPKLRSWLSRSGGAIDVTIELPSGSHVDGTLALGDFDSDGTLGDCRIKTGHGRLELERAGTLDLTSGAGNISVDRVMGRAEVTMGSGKVRLRELYESAVVKNSNGDTWIGEATGELRLNTANGDVSVDLAHAGVVAKSANGDVRLGEVTRGSVVLETKVGDLEVGIREGTAAWLDVSSRFGHVRNSLAAAGAPDPSAETVEVRARTSMGEVLIHRS